MTPSNSSPASAVPQRLASLDILRGFDLFLLVFFQPVFVALGQQAQLPWLTPLLVQFDHEVWEGFRCWDLVMPLFLFMTGASIPFALSRYKEGSNRTEAYRKIARRFVILFLLGMVVQGNLLGLDPMHIYLYTNTLQAIACGYAIASLAWLHSSLKGQLVLTIGLLIAYALPMMWVGDFSPEGNFAEQVDRLILGRFRDATYWDEHGQWHFSPYYNYTWIWSSLTFGVTVLLGSFAGQLMKAGKTQRLKVAGRLAGIGIALVIGGSLWGLQMPIIKRLWTSSMTLLSGGYCFLLMALFYYIIDCKGHTKGLEWLKIYGMNSITAYMLGECVNFRCIAASLFYGLERYMGDYYSVWLTFVNFLIVFVLLRAMYRRGVFIRI